MNLVILSGRLVYEPELKVFDSGSVKLPLRIAVSRNDKNHTSDFFNCQAWNNTAEFIKKYFHKGHPIEIIGKLQNDSYEKQDGTKVTETYIFVTEVNFVLSKPNDETRPEPVERSEATQEPLSGSEPVGEVPFEI